MTSTEAEYLQKQIDENPELKQYIDQYGFTISPSRDEVYRMTSEQLLAEMELISLKQSKLSSTQRKLVQQRIKFI